MLETDACELAVAAIEDRVPLKEEGAEEYEGGEESADEAQDTVAEEEESSAEAETPEEYEEADQHESIRRGMEDAVPCCIQFKVLKCVDRIPAAQHVVPLKQLVEHGAVEKSPSPRPNRMPAELENRSGRTSLTPFCQR